MKPPVVEAVGLTQTYTIKRGPFRAPARLQAVGGVSFAVGAGRTLAVVGESGCGKSTLARMVTLIETPTHGTLRLQGVDAVGAGAQQRRALRRVVQLVFQNPFGSLNPRKKIGSILEAPLVINTTLTADEREQRSRAMLAKVGLRPEHYGRYPHMFSGGQRQRIAIARTLMLDPALVVADEPVSALDVSVQAQVLNLLADLQQELGLVASLYTRLAGRHAGHRQRRTCRAHRAERRTAFAVEPARRMRVLDPLSVRGGPLQRRTAGVACARWPAGILSPCRAVPGSEHSLRPKRRRRLFSHQQ